MEVFRLSSRKWANELSGKGAALFGGRWNSPGTEIIYTAENRSLAMAEVVVHFSLAIVPDNYMMVTIHVPDNISIRNLSPAKLPENWNAFPYVGSTRFAGDDFIRTNRYALLRVPSAVTKGDFNYLINPFHRDFSRIKIIAIEPFPFDSRLCH